MRVALTIAGSDSGGGAGIQADLKTFAAHGVYGTSALTAVTAQNSLGVTMSLAIPAEVVTAQMGAVVSDFGAHSAKTGMLANAGIVEAVAAAIEELEIPWLIVDPVMLAKSGDRLLDEDAVEALRSELLRRAFVVTPNVPEAEVLSGMRIESSADCREAARRIHALGPSCVIVKGGHLPTSDIVDLLYDGRQFDDFRTERVPGGHTHGTGCTFSAALAAHLALERGLREAIPLAQAYVEGAIRNAPQLGLGNGPMNHFWEGRRDGYTGA